MYFSLLYKKRVLKKKPRLLLLLIFFFINLAVKAQEIDLSVKNASIQSVFSAIKKQTGYNFIFTTEDMLDAKPITLSIHHRSLPDALALIFKDQPLTYTLKENYVLIKPKRTGESGRVFEIKGMVTNEKGEPVISASVKVKNSNEGTLTDEEGKFDLKTTVRNSVLIISSIGFETMEIAVAGKLYLVVTMKTSVSKLDETVVIAYGSTTRRLNTGSVSKITADEISRQPVANLLASLSGRLPGLLITQSGGLPGASFKVQIRGQNSIAQSNDPLIIIDGVPYAANNNNINQVGAAFSFGSNGLSPFNSINPSDIESVEILKDADATAIYGSRGANGVVLITTKRGKPGKTKLDFNIYTGAGRIPHIEALLNTKQYLQMRQEAFRNDGITPTNSNAYDLLVWDTTRYTDFKKLLIGKTAYITDAEASVSGGSEQTQFLLNASYHRETTVFPGKMANNRGSYLFQINHSSTNKKITFHFSGIYSFDNNNIITADLSNFINLPPNLPELHDADGNLNWSQGGFAFNNPLSYLRLSYLAKTDNFLGNFQFNYQLARHLNLKSNIGYNLIDVNEISTRPIDAQNPAYNPKGSSQFGRSTLRSLIMEPQLEYSTIVLKGKLTILAGGTWQQNTNDGSFIFASGYTNDALLKSISGAANLYATSNNSEYRYAAVFGRLNYRLHNKYLVNVTGRRDGSSRFGPNRQYADFGALGTAWIFSNEKFFQSRFHFLSYGKIRASYGITGNDGIGDYNYLDSYSPSNYPYQGVGGTYPTGLFNPDYGWEINRKLEFAAELGFWKDRILLTIGYYRNRSGNQLVQYALPSQTGFFSVNKNLPALVQNTGWEFEISGTVFKNRELNWYSSFTLTAPKNELLSFPNLPYSAYRNRYLIGQSLNIGNGYVLVGVDPQTGVYQFYDSLKKFTSAPIYPRDLVKGLHILDPLFYGGFRNSLQFHGFQVDLFFEFRKQIGFSYLRDVSQLPGTMRNQPALVLNRWQKRGDITTIQRYTQSYSSPVAIANNAIIYYGASNLYTDASFIRFKNFSLSYRLSKKMIKKIHLSSCRLYLEGENLFTITDYVGGDPETQHYFFLPPLKTITAGIQLTL